MSNKYSINESIECYCSSSSDCNIMKILMDPIDYLKLSSQKRKTDKNIDAFSALGLIDTTMPTLYEESREFISTEEEFEIFLQHIQNILIKGYQNYVDDNVKMPSKVYRAITKNELNFLVNNQRVSTLYSTDSSMDTIIGFIMEKTEHDWSPKERIILEMPIYQKMPFIDVDNDSKTIFEPNEIILLPSFNLSKIRIKNKGNTSLFSLYDEQYISKYTAIIKPHILTPNSNISEINKLYEFLMNNLIKYEEYIENYMNHKVSDKIFKDNDFKKWIISLKRFIDLETQYVHDCVLHDKLPEVITKRK